MLARTLFLAVGSLLAVGCAAPRVAAPEAGGPADPRAAESPLPPRSHTLDLADSALPPLPKAEPAAEMKPEMNGAHAGHLGHEGHEAMHHAVAPTQPDEAAALSAPRWTPTTVPATSPADGTGHSGPGGRAGHEHEHGGTEP